MENVSKISKKLSGKKYRPGQHYCYISDRNYIICMYKISIFTIFTLMCNLSNLKDSVFNKFYEDLTIPKEIRSIEKEDNKRGFTAVRFTKRV